MRTEHLEREDKKQSLIVANKDDEVEDTFCYKLFELGEFDVAKVQELRTSKLCVAQRVERQRKGRFKVDY